MPNKKVLALAAFCLQLVPFSLYAAEVKNLRVGQTGNKGFATYDLLGRVGEREAEVAVSLTIAGERYRSDQLTLSGDFGKNVKVGLGRRISWDTLADLPAGFNGEVSWEVDVARTITAPAATVKVESEEQRTLYAIGLSLSNSLSVFNMSPEEFGYMRQGLQDAALGRKEKLSTVSYRPRVQELAKERKALEKVTYKGADYRLAMGTDLDTEENKLYYSVGVVTGEALSVFSLTEQEYKIVELGLLEDISGDNPRVELKSYTAKIQDLAKARRKLSGERSAPAQKRYLETAAAEKGAVTTASGLVYTTLREGRGASPVPSNTVKVHYRGNLIDGKEFDSSYARGGPLEVALDKVIKCWTEGLQRMAPGGKAKLVCPSNLAYGESGAGQKIGPGATLIFEVELLEVK